MLYRAVPLMTKVYGNYTVDFLSAAWQILYPLLVLEYTVTVLQILS
jgi:hypothetical protein